MTGRRRRAREQVQRPLSLRYSFRSRTAEKRVLHFESRAHVMVDEELNPPLVLTIGHSARTLEDFIELVRAHGVTRLVDVRTVPRSRHNPQFNLDTLPDALGAAGIRYVHMPGLGGLRHPRPDSPNAGWRNASFRGYADYMQTPEFEAGLQALVKLAGQRQLAIMCAEAVPWRCHRSLISDALTVRGVKVEHIMSATRRQAHVLTPFARVDGLRVTYPPEPGEAQPAGARSSQP